MRSIIGLFVLLFVPLSASATNFTVKSGGGGNFTTIDACVSQMNASGGDTCTVFAGTYTPSATIVAGAANNYNVLTVNGSDIVTVNGNVTIASHTKIVGNCPTLTGNVITTATCGFFFSQPSSPTSSCVTIPSSSITDYYIEFNVFYACHPMAESFSTPTTFGYYIGNTISYTDTTTTSPDEGCGINLQGDHKFMEQNEFTHVAEGFRVNGKWQVARNNVMHDNNESEVSGSHCDTHPDFDETTPGSSSLAVQFVLFENNRNYNRVGVDNHFNLTQVTSNTLDTWIARFNVVAHNGSAGMENDQNATHVNSYNNTWVDMNTGNPQGGGFTNMCRGGATGATYLNDLFYYPQDETAGSGHTVTPIAIETCTGNLVHNHLAWCTVGTCTGITAYSESGSWTNDATNLLADPKFVSYSSGGLGDLHLQAGSPALNAGTNLTTVGNTDTGSGVSLTVNNATLFQDGWGFPAGSGLGQMTPDTICVTTVSNCVAINAGGINYSTNIITLASGITRSVGDKVWLQKDSTGTLRLTGSAPNIGALGQIAAGNTTGSQLSGGVTLSGGTVLQ